VRGRLVLVRHGVTDWNREGRFQGHLDPPLSIDGAREAQLVAARLAASPQERPGRIVSSPLSRARQTAEAIAEALHGRRADVGLDPRLIEVGQGEWEGRTHAELAITDADRYAAWRRQAGVREPPGGEPIEDALVRIAAALDEHIRAAGPWPLCVVAHGGSLRLAARHLLGLGARRAWALEMDNAACSLLEPEGESWRLVAWNDTRHLLGRAATHVGEDDGEAMAL
jgi:broad specificity phosphatase PhoE